MFEFQRRKEPISKTNDLLLNKAWASLDLSFGAGNALWPEGHPREEASCRHALQGLFHCLLEFYSGLLKLHLEKVENLAHFSAFITWHWRRASSALVWVSPQGGSKHLRFISIACLLCVSAQLGAFGDKFILLSVFVFISDQDWTSQTLMCTGITWDSC